ncbi:MAG TPA: thioredoxin family protein, partial [Acidobacteriota bacterium]|nr:thioredoxin family protein [Acidobacteriota bacterium]
MAKLITGTGAKEHAVVPHSDWIAARKELLLKEKEFTRSRDALSRQRRDLPWEKVEKQYVFDGPNGKETLADLFGRKSQLIVYHFMFAPDWDQGCPHCSFWADNFNDILVHLKQRDVAMVAISRAPLEKLEAFKKHMGWSFPWLSSLRNDFNYDYHVSFTPEDLKSGEAFYNYTKGQKAATDREGVSVFYKDESGAVYHTYSSYARGIDVLNTAYNYLDLAPKGRDEEGL